MHSWNPYLLDNAFFPKVRMPSSSIISHSALARVFGKTMGMIISEKNDKHIRIGTRISKVYRLHLYTFNLNPHIRISFISTVFLRTQNRTIWGPPVPANDLPRIRFESQKKIATQMLIVKFNKVLKTALELF